MTASSMDHFITIEYIQKLRQADFTEKQAEAVAEIVELQSQRIQEQKNNIEQLRSKDLATKGDIKALELATKSNLKNGLQELELKIEQLRSDMYKSKYETLAWVAGMFIASGLFQHFFK